MRVMVTGGAGYIGSVTAAALLERGHEVLVIDRLDRDTRHKVPAGAAFLQADIGEPASYRHVLEGVEACLHFAASIEAGASMLRPEAYFVNNTAATLRLLQTLLEAGIERFVLSSTAAVYGEPVRLPIDESDPTVPVNAYGRSKLFIEEALDWLHRLRGLRYAALRYFNAAGAHGPYVELHQPETHLIPLVLQAATGARDHISVFGTDYDTADGTCVRDYVHVADLADAHVRALDALDEHGRIVCNLGNGRGFSVREVIAAATRATGRDIPTRLEPRRDGDPAVLVASWQRAHRLLGWAPAHTELDAIVASAWEHQPQRGLAPRAVTS